MDNIRLRQLVLEFVKLAVYAVPVDEAEDFTVPEMLTTWAADPGCMLSSMFLGYVIGEGEDINAFSPEALRLAVLSCAECESSDVNFDWIGDCDATSKPH